MAKGRAAAFEESRPTITEQEVWDAAKRDSLVLSFNALPISKESGKVDFLGIKMMLADGTAKIVLFDRYSCSVLCGLAGTLEKGQWMVHQSTPSGQTRQ